MRIRHANRTNLKPNRHAAAFGPNLKIAFVDLQFSVDQAGGASAETYTTTGVVITQAVLAYVGLTRAYQIFQRAPTYGEAVGTPQSVSIRWTAATRRLMIWNAELSNTEIANGNSLTGIELKLMILGV